MKTLILKKVLVLLTFNIVLLSTFAQAPQSFKYQSVIRDANGNVIQNQAVDFRISILQTSSTGTPVYVEEFATTTNNFGLVNLNIGTGTVISGAFSSIAWGADNYFLQVEIDADGNGYQLMGTSQLLSVPYALNAAKADNVNNNDTSATNEIQILSIFNDTIYLTNGGFVKLPAGFSGDYNDLINKPTIPTYTSDLINDLGFIMDPDDADADPYNEIQTISKSGSTVTLSNGGGSFTDEVNDNDSDPTNEIQAISFSNDTLYLSNGSSVYLGNYSNIWQQNGNDIYYNNGYVGVGLTDPHGKLIVQGDASIPADSAIFEVRNKDGQVIFAVYQEGVRVYVDDTGTKGISSKGGFAVGGFNATKSFTNEYLRVTPDSVRIYIQDDNGSKAISTKGGFAIGGFNATKSFTNNYLRVTDDSTRIWTRDSVAGFGVRNLGGNSETSYMQLNPQNYFIGENSGINITTGLYNTTFGFNAGYGLANGGSNILIGYNAGYNNSSGNHNIIMGRNAGYNMTSGDYNIILGTGAAASFTSTSFSVNIGINSGNHLTSGTNNTFIGTNSGLFLSGAYRSVLIGTDCGRGGSAANNTTSYENTIIGTFAGYNITSASHNTIIGYQAGHQLTTGSDNVFIGYNAGYNELGSNKLYIANSSTYNPLIYGDFSTGKVTINDVLKLTPKSSAPTSPTEGEIYVDTNHHIYCYLNSAWRQLDN